MNPPPAESAPGAEHARWFAEEVHPHDGNLRAYLRNSFPGMHDVDDVVQESYLRVWRAKATQPIRSTKAFLFQVARHLAFDFARRKLRSPVDFIPDIATLRVIDAGPGAVQAVSTKEEVALLARALDSLPARCRDVMVLRRIEGVSQKEIAARLGISELTVQTHVVHGLRRLKVYFREYGAR